ncbi:MAG: response regulator receiver protein [Cyanobacteria bacterium RYN_339]|nr:response regulator receiver protein [Cyanobacteria bacterium RYN_339]
MSAQPILLVEDNPDDEALTLRALKRNNIANEVIVARSGEEALEYLFAEDQTFEMVLLDMNLPLMNGLEVLRRLREHPRTRGLPVVMLTTSTEDEDVAASYKLGANSYVKKPVDFVEFVDAVRQVGAYWLVLNVGPGRGTP